jgi:hypothetical protein
LNFFRRFFMPYTFGTAEWEEAYKKTLAGRKQLDPVKGMMQEKLKLKGDLPTIVKNVKGGGEPGGLERSRGRQVSG